MESSKPLSTESFSYSWLINLRPSFESLGDSFRASLDASDETSSFIEMDPWLTPSKRFLGDAQDFSFDFPVSKSPLSDLVDADELFSNGLLMPFFHDNPAKASDSVPTPLRSSSESSKLVLSTSRSACPFLGRWQRSSKRIFQKYMGFLRPLYKKLRVLRLGARGEITDARVRPFVKSWDESPLQTSPRASSAYPTGDWCAIESSIHEAVLHCKKSIEK